VRSLRGRAQVARLVGFAIRRLLFGALTILLIAVGAYGGMRALAQAEPATIDVPTLQALGLWAAMLIVGMSALADIALVRIDPRLRTGQPPG
jgi:ABC-type dipeptide/oligopeptide/nickel transport system permease component